MAIYHHFVEHDFGQGLCTHNAILDITPYEPELLILGTYNPKTSVNQSDFFYHRNYFWPTINNLFKHNRLVELKRRQYSLPQTPKQDEIISLCGWLHLTFADLIKCALPRHAQSTYKLIKNVVVYQGKEYNLIDDKALEQLDILSLIEWNTTELIRYLQQKPSIRYVRFTRQPYGVFKSQWERIISAKYDRQIDFGSIHSPSGQGLREPGIQAAKSLARRWLFHASADQRLPDEWVEKYLISSAPFQY